MKILNKELTYNGHFKIFKFTLEDENKPGKHIAKECFERGNSVAALLYNQDSEKYILTKQFRIGSQSELLEIVAGSMDVPGEAPVRTIAREIAEEVGYKMTDEPIEYYGFHYVSPGGTSEGVHLYFINVKEKIADGGGVEDESIETVEIAPQKLLEIVSDGQITDLKTLFVINAHFYGSVYMRKISANENVLI